MMQCSETIGPKSNTDQLLEPQEFSDRFRLPRPGGWRCILLVQSTSIGLWGCTGRRLRLPLEHHTRRCGRFHHSASISDGTSAKKSRKGPEGPEASREADFRHP